MGTVFLARHITLFPEPGTENDGALGGDAGCMHALYSRRRAKAAEYCFVDACHDLGAYTFQYGRLSGREVLALGHGMEDFLYDWEVGIGFEEGAESVG